MGNRQSSLIQLPANITNFEEIRRVLDVMIKEIDTIQGYRGVQKAKVSKDILGSFNSIGELRQAINRASENYATVDGKTNFKEIVSYDVPKTFTKPNDIIDKRYVDNLYAPQIAPTDLAPTATLGDVIGKVNEILTILKLTKIIV